MSDYDADAYSKSCLKVLMVWFLPTLVVPTIIVLTAGAWPVGVLVSIGFLFLMGRFAAEDSQAQAGGDAKPPVGRVILYVILQIIWIPLFLFGTFWAICMYIGGPKF